MRCTAPVLLALSLSLALAPASAPAAIVTTYFEGIVTENLSDPGEFYQFTRGERISLVVNYDPATVPDMDPDPAVGDYDFGGSVEGPIATLTTSGGNRREFNELGTEFIRLGATDEVFINLIGPSYELRFSFEAPAGTLSSDAMLTAADFFRFPAGPILYDSGTTEENTVGFRGTLIAVDVAPAPEPSTLAGLGVGLGVLGLIRARRRA